MFYLLFVNGLCLYNILSHNEKLQSLVTKLVLSFYFVIRRFNQTNKHKTKSFIIKVLSRPQSTQHQIVLIDHEIILKMLKFVHNSIEKVKPVFFTFLNVYLF